MKRQGLLVIYTDPLWIGLAVIRTLMMIRYGHSPDLWIAGLALLSLLRAWNLAHRKEKTI